MGGPTGMTSRKLMRKKRWVASPSGFILLTTIVLTLTTLHSSRTIIAEIPGSGNSGNIGSTAPCPMDLESTTKVAQVIMHFLF